MIRTLSIAAALTVTTAFVAPISAAAETGAYYSATPVTAPDKASVITSGTLWKCAEGVCTAARGTQRDMIMCQLVAQRVGALSGFSVAGAPMDAAALAKCNERARS